MRKPRNFDAALKTLTEKTKALKESKRRQFGDLIVATGADALDIETLAGALIATVQSTDAAQIIGLWGIGMIEALVSTPQTEPEKVMAMWSAVEQAFREARLVEPRLGRDFWSQANARLFALWPQACVAKAAAGQNASPVDIASLSRALAPYVEISSDFMAVIVSMDQAGISASELDQAVQHTGQNLLQILTRFFEIARGLDDRRIWNPEWVSALRALKEKIVITRMSTPTVGT